MSSGGFPHKDRANSAGKGDAGSADFPVAPYSERTMTPQAGLGGRGDRSPQTRRSVVVAARDADPEVRRQAWEALVGSYWRPVYKVLRGRWRLDREDAEDFATALTKGTFARYDPARARFRTYVRTCLRRFRGQR